MQESDIPERLISGGLGDAAGTDGAPSPSYGGDTDARHFAADVLEASQETPIMVDFWAPWCGPCKQLTPLLEEAVRRHQGAVRLYKVNIDENQMLARQLQVQSIPAVFAFVGGRAVDGFIGVRSAREVEEFVARLAALKEGGGAPPLEALLLKAKEAREAGDLSQATQIYAEILRADPSALSALGGLAECSLESGNPDQARKLLGELPDDKKSDPALRPAFAALALADKTAELPQSDALYQKIAENPQDWSAQTGLALLHHTQGHKEQAIKALLQIIQKAPQQEKDAAKAQLFELFDSYGAEDEATISGRRALSSLLFR